MRWFRAKQPKWKYSAFISYRHAPADRRWAEWVIETLNAFNTPDELVQQGIKPRIGSLFRDDKEMAVTADLSRYLKEALWASEHLIVVCSNETPFSDWVRAEISLFKHWGRSRNIHALLIDPDPRRALPAELRYWRIAGQGPDAVMELAEPAAAVVTPAKGKSEAELNSLARDKLAASLLNCDLGTLRQALAKQEQEQISIRYFGTMTFRRGIPEGVGEVLAADVGARYSTLRFETRAGRIERVRCISGLGQPSEDSAGISQWDVIYRSDGSVESLEKRDSFGLLKSRENLSRDATQVDFVSGTDTALAQGLSSSFFSFNLRKSTDASKSVIVRHRIEYDENGFITRKYYMKDSFDTPTPDALGNYGEACERDVHGLPTRIWFFGHTSQKLLQANGVAVVEYRYDGHNRVAEVIYLGADESTVLSTKGCARIVPSYDAHGNRVSLTYLGIDGALVTCKNGYARTTQECDEHGNCVEQSFFGTDGELILTKDGYARTVQAYDADGNCIELNCFGMDGKAGTL